jgi:hypothetical protein
VEGEVSPYLRADETIHNMSLAIAWITDLSDRRIVRRELSCAGFDADDIEQYADCAITYVEARRKLFGGNNQMVTYED